MSDHSKIEWTDATLVDAGTVHICQRKSVKDGFNPITEAFRGHPFNEVPITLGRVARAASGDHVARHSPAPVLDGLDVIPCCGWPRSAIGTEATVVAHQQPYCLKGHRIKASLPRAGSLLSIRPKARVRPVPGPFSFSGVHATDAATNIRFGEPGLAVATPRKANLSALLPLGLARAWPPMNAATSHADRGVSAGSREVDVKVLDGPPNTTLSAVLFAARDVVPVLANGNSQPPGGHLQDTFSRARVPLLSGVACPLNYKEGAA